MYQPKTFSLRRSYNLKTRSMLCFMTLGIRITKCYCKVFSCPLCGLFSQMDFYRLNFFDSTFLLMYGGLSYKTRPNVENIMHFDKWMFHNNTVYLKRKFGTLSARFVIDDF